jgi:hypothetical protein
MRRIGINTGRIAVQPRKATGKEIPVNRTLR